MSIDCFTKGFGLNKLDGVLIREISEKMMLHFQLNFAKSQGKQKFWALEENIFVFILLHSTTTGTYCNVLNYTGQIFQVEYFIFNKEEYREIILIQLYIISTLDGNAYDRIFSSCNYYNFDKINCWLRLLIKSCLSGLYFNQAFIPLSSSEQLIDNWGWQGTEICRYGDWWDLSCLRLTVLTLGRPSVPLPR